MHASKNEEVPLPSLRSEIAPLVRHTIVVSTLIAIFTFMGFLLEAVAIALPSHHDEIRTLQSVDFWLVVAVLVLLAIYTTAIIGLRLWRSFTAELSHQPSVANQTLDPDEE